MTIRGDLLKVFDVTLTLSTDQYADADVLAATQEIGTVCRPEYGAALWHSLAVIDKADQAAAMDVIVLDSNGAIGTENAAVSIADTVADNICGIVEVSASDYVDLANSQVATKSSLGVTCNHTDSTGKLYCAVVSRGTGTYTATSVVLRFGFLAG